MGGEDRRERQRVDAVRELDHPVVQLLGVSLGLARVELRHIDPTGDDLALGPDQQRAGRRRLDLVERAVEVVVQLE